MPKAARFGDPHTCPKVEPGPTPHVGGPIASPCSPDVLVEDARAARVNAARTGDFAKCEAGTPDFIRIGSPNVFINDMNAARLGDGTVHGGVITGGAAEVEIGVEDDGVALLPLDAAATSDKRADQRKVAGSDGKPATKPDAGASSGDHTETQTPPRTRYLLRVMAHGRNWIGSGEFSFAGHIFVAWGTVQDGHEPVFGDSVGFGPSKESGSHTGWFDSCDGEIWVGEKNGVATYKTDFELDEASWNASRAVQTSFDHTSYSVTTNDCGSFVMDVARAAGLTIWFRPIRQTPVEVYWAITSANASKVYLSGLDDGAVL